MDDFRIPPVSTLIGSRIGNYFSILKKGKVAPRYYFKIFLSTIVILIATPFHWWEDLFFYRKLKKVKFEKPPLFILGHWRSGTTLLHNMLTKDPSAGFVTTYLAVFPNNMASKWLFRTFMRLNMPEKRPSDGVVLNVDFPQEDEFAFTNLNPNAYYNFFYFPENYSSFFNKAVYHDGMSEREIAKWYSDYNYLLKKAAIETGGKRLIIKNPVNTARIDKILKLFPEAKFLYIYRNPVTVFFSTQRFFQQLFPTLWLHRVNDTFINGMIFDIYQRLIEEYQKGKQLIPEGNLLEIRFEEFERDPVKAMDEIYSFLLKEDFSTVKEHFSAYFKTQKSHKKNKYLVDAEILDAIKTNLGKYMVQMKYDVPEEITVKQS